MIGYRDDEENRVIEFIIGEKVTEKEYNLALSKFKNRLDEWDNIKILELVVGLKGIEPLALWKDIKFAVQKFGEINNKVSKCAVVADKMWIKVLTKIFDPFIKSEVRFFDPSKEKEAREWLVDVKAA